LTRLFNMNHPIFSAVIAAYQIEKYADDLFRSIEKQSICSDLLEVVVIDDGSQDQTLDKARSWAARSRFRVTVETQPNMGVAAARNKGIDISNGEWIAFVDSDDVLDRKYFEALSVFIDRDVNKAASMLTSRSLIFNEKTGTAQDNHPLAWKYRRGDRLVSLDREPHVVHLAGHATIVRADIVKSNQIRFSDLVKPAFEDAHFIGLYLAQFEEPVLGLVASARYYYRKRADGSSLIDTTWLKPEKYTNEPKYGHLGLLNYLLNKKGYVPVWAQNTVLYSLYWYFRADRMIDSPLKSVSTDLMDQLWESLEEIFKLIDASTIRNFNLVNYGWGLKEGILRHFKNESIIPGQQTIGYMWNADDIKRNTRKVGYTFAELPPSERVFVDGTYTDVYIAKSIRHMSFGRTLMYERVLILPRVQTVEIYLNGRKISIKKPVNDAKKNTSFISAPKELQLSSGTYAPSASELVRRAKKSSGINRFKYGFEAIRLKTTEETWITGSSRIGVCYRLSQRLLSRYRKQKLARKMKRRDSETILAARSEANLVKFKDLWIIMDHPVRADDNGEHFYRYVRDNHPQINAVFMLKKDSKDWNRLSSEGFNLIEYGSDEAVYSTLNAKFIISSHIDAGIYDPVSRRRFGVSPARRVFLQHGLVMNDLSRWLNTKGLALMIASSPMEFDAFAGDGSTYKFTRKEVSLTGLPRHDNLVIRSQEDSVDRKYISFVPTWRQNLVAELNKCSDIEQRKNILHSSQFYKSWKLAVNNPRTLSLAENHEYEVVFVLHDHLAKFRDLFDFGSKVRICGFSELNVQEFLLKSAALVTDYSSIATEAAITGAPIAYYQFDSESIFSSGHTFTQGWFSYSDNGFGPVFAEPDDVVDWIESRSNDGWSLSDKYLHRLNETLPLLDGKASQRVFESILDLDERLFN